MTQGNATTFINGLTSDTKLLRSDDSVLRFRVLNESIYRLKRKKVLLKKEKKFKLYALFAIQYIILCLTHTQIFQYVLLCIGGRVDTVRVGSCVVVA